ncbi:Predicted metalloprotease, contains C-terminal PDZ domain [Gillisia sp. Hel1_33_143]|uniref:M61 family metallopeptidase n=1 Tax=Gillisia sp. Hel1_33_143 TaxID=1336796 RepID=UPI00087C6A88|nr:PDZ domain-containing protein [Gillisia sp. Hel1_33_143]SDR93113.1 Predicted metalloprotease, contains C-terminal PDZ domain [Gillisia sp. Hel1_33_143]
MYKFLFFLLITAVSFGQTNTYQISFENAAHHEATVNATFPNIKSHTLKVEMSRSSPGRYAVHEFAKNVYNLKATNGKGEELTTSRPDPYSWEISDHDGTVNISYTLFANHGDGTYSQVDNTHAHLNIPATFIFSKTLEHRPIEVTIDIPANSNWKVATQLKELSATKYAAPDLYYFMDSPMEISDFDLRSFNIDGQDIRFALHHPGTKQEFDEYFEKVKKIVEQQKLIFGELPKYDFGNYTFLACYMPNVTGDGMEHRNSTILTDVESLAEGGMKGNIGTVSHEYFHSWNVERIRPADLEPFDFTKANMSGSLWFAEGFTSYYTNLVLTRAKIISPEDYIKSLNGTFNYVWNSPAHKYFNPIEMSYQAPFVDAATSVDAVNRENTFISYYSYGSILGLALDLKLRENNLNLDDFMKLMWITYGKPEVAYTIKDIQTTLAKYAGQEFADEFFSNYIYKSEMPKYADLLKTVGLKLEQLKESAYFGASVKEDDNKLIISSNPKNESPAYKAFLSEGDEIKAANDSIISSKKAWSELLKSKKSGDKLQLVIVRNRQEQKTEVTLEEDPAYTISIDAKADKKAVKMRETWLKSK